MKTNITKTTKKFTLCGSNYPYLKQIFEVPSVFEPMKFDCNSYYYCCSYTSRQNT